jgi:hypothetical protein
MTLLGSGADYYHLLSYGHIKGTFNFSSSKLQRQYIHLAKTPIILKNRVILSTSKLVFNSSTHRQILLLL